MANEIFSPTSNSGQGHLVGGVSSADSTSQLLFRVDPTTKRLLVAATLDTSTGVADNDPVNASTTGNLALGTDGSNYQVLSVNSSGRLQVDVISGGSGGVQYTEGDTDSTITGTAILWEDSADTLRSVSVAKPLPVQEGGAALTALQKIDDPVLVDDAAFTPASSSVMVAGFTADEVAPDSVNEGDIGAARMSLNRNIYVQLRDNAGNERGLNIDANGEIGIGAIRTSIVPGTAATNLGKAEDAVHASGDTGVMMLAVRDDTIGATSGTEGDYEALHTNENGALWVEHDVSTKGGWSVGNFTSGDSFTALTNTAQVIKGSAGKFGGYYIYNPNSSVAYVIVYDVAAASVTVGTTNPKLVFCIPATGGANLEILAGIPFGTAMSVAATTTGGGSTAPSTALEAMIWYK